MSLAATIAAEWRGDRGGRLIAVVAGAGLHGSGRHGRPRPRPPRAGAAGRRRAAAVADDAGPAALLERLAAIPAAGFVVVGAGRGRLADALRQTLQRPVASLDAAALHDLDFYEPPIAWRRRGDADMGQEQ